MSTEDFKPNPLFPKENKFNPRALKSVARLLKVIGGLQILIGIVIALGGIPLGLIAGIGLVLSGFLFAGFSELLFTIMQIEINTRK